MNPKVLKAGLALVIAAGALAAAKWGHDQATRPASSIAAVLPEAPAQPLPQVCPIAGDCKLPGDENRAPVGDGPSTMGLDRILPKD